MTRWVVFNHYRTSDGVVFEVYVDAPDAERAREVAVEYFEVLAEVCRNTNADFADPARFDIARVSAVVTT